MYLFKRRSDMHAILPCIFAHTNVLLGVIGFYHAAQAVRGGRISRAHRLWMRSYGCMFAILGFGYRRFMYPGYAWRSGRRRRSLWRSAPAPTGKTV